MNLGKVIAFSPTQHALLDYFTLNNIDDKGGGGGG